MSSDLVDAAGNRGMIDTRSSIRRAVSRMGFQSGASRSGWLSYAAGLTWVRGGIGLLLIDRGIKDRVSFEHIVDGAGQFDAELVQGPGFAVFGFDRVRVVGGGGEFSFVQEGGLAEGPAEIGVADLALSGGGALLAVAGVGTLGESCIGEKVTARGEAVDGSDLIEDRQGEDVTDAGGRLESKKGIGVVSLGGLQQVEFQSVDLLIEGVDPLQVDIGIESAAGMIEVLPDCVAVTFVAEVAGGFGEVLLEVKDLNVSQEFGASADEEGAAAHQVPRGTHCFRVGISHGEVSSPQKTGDLFRVDGIVLDLPTVDGLHVERVAKNEGDLLLLAPVGEPVPVERGFASQDQVGAAEWLELDLEAIDLGCSKITVELFPTLVIEHADVQAVAVQIDPGVEFVLLDVELHLVPPWESGS